ncbi:hypothetical protein C5X80_004015 [Klebsiella pneumoniae subsp. pneumoniae]|nr:hypothetical protein C5X80_004015 [Klebsiella pneumoniae subsp. pneumoniae]
MPSESSNRFCSSLSFRSSRNFSSSSYSFNPNSHAIRVELTPVASRIKESKRSFMSNRTVSARAKNSFNISGTPSCPS